MGAKLIPALAGGAAGLKKMGDEADRLGYVMSGKTIDAADELGDKLQTLTDVTKKNFESGYLSAFADDSGKIEDIYTDPGFGQGLKEIGAGLGTIVDLAIRGADAFGKLLPYLSETAKKTTLLGGMLSMLGGQETAKPAAVSNLCPRQGNALRFL